LSGWRAKDEAGGVDGKTILIPWPWLLGSAVVCGIATVAGLAAERLWAQQDLALTFYLVAYVAGAWDATRVASGKLKHFRIDIDFLMIAVALGAAFIGAWWEGAILLFLFSLSNALEAMAMARTDREIRSLFRETPKQALELLPDGGTREIDAISLRAGAIIRILPGQQFPADGLVLSGESAADESSLTGESMPVAKRPGENVFGGTLNAWGALDLQVTRSPGDSAHARIIRLIREAQGSKAPSQRFTDRFGTGYTVSILGLSVLMFFVWQLWFDIPAFRAHGDERSAFYRAMTLLVVCSPCALVISIPSAILSGIAAGARRGILFRGGVALENLAIISRLAVDKTGTLTQGELQFVGLEVADGSGADMLLADAAALSRNSTHPISRAIVAEQMKRGLPRLACGGFKSLPGKGLTGQVDGREVALGRRSLFAHHSWIMGMPDPGPGLTEVLVEAGEKAGRLLFRDAPRPEAAVTIALLKKRGIKVTMLTGDREESARLIADELKLSDWKSGLQPEDKVAAIQHWRASGERVAMAGDGVNDAPSLAAADVSIGMGLRGSDAVLDQADIVLIKDRLERILEAHDLSRRCRTIIRQNLGVSLGVIVVLGLGALGGYIPLPIGVLGHEGSTVVVVLNSLRLLWRRD
jgi:Zn2+/Cd2+-exporting ATPase